MLEEYYFDVAKIGDAVCVVNDRDCFMRFDTVMNIFFSGEGEKKKYIHLKKSKMIIAESQKNILYHKKDAERLDSALNQLRSSTDKNWISLLPAMMNNENNEPHTPPVPKTPQR